MQVVAANLIERPDQFRNTDEYGAYTLVYTICARGPLMVGHREFIALAVFGNGQRLIDDCRKMNQTDDQ